MLALLEALGKIVLKQPGVVLHVHNPSTQQAEAGAPQVQVPPGLPGVSSQPGLRSKRTKQEALQSSLVTHVPGNTVSCSPDRQLHL